MNRDIVDILQNHYDAKDTDAWMSCLEAKEEIVRLQEVLKECAKNFTTKSSNHKIAAQEILDEFERRALIARAALEQKESK